MGMCLSDARPVPRGVRAAFQSSPLIASAAGPTAKAAKLLVERGADADLRVGAASLSPAAASSRITCLPGRGRITELPAARRATG
jgi:hypothetical protein